MIYVKKAPVFEAETFVAELDGSKCQSLPAFYKNVATALHFPDYFGKNLDAFEECLADLSWLADAKAIALVIQKSDLFLKKTTAAKRADVLDIFTEANASPLDDGRVLKIYGL